MNMFSEARAFDQEPMEEENTEESVIETAQILAEVKRTDLKRAIKQVEKNYDLQQDLHAYNAFVKDLNGDDKAAALRAAQEVLTRETMRIQTMGAGRPSEIDEVALESLLDQLAATKRFLAKYPPAS